MKILIQFEKKPLLFQRPKHIISCFNPSSFRDSFQAMEDAIQEGYYLAGFLSYEAGYYFEEKLCQDKTRDFPLIYMGVYDAPFTNKEIPAKNPCFKNTLKDLRLNISKEEYFSNIGAIRDYIAKGDVYQITYCIKLLFSFQGGLFPLYLNLLKDQPVPYPAYIETDEFQILSLSPEKFIKKTSSRVVTKPMKGTWPRGNNIFSDAMAQIRFQYDGKNRAENVMIADLLRNDLGRIGTDVKTLKLFEVTKYRTLYQMTSTVASRIDKDMPIYELFASLFPSGSVTGAPKIRAMEIIRELEHEERKIYTGAIGYITPDKDLFFNIPIRTLLIQDEIGEMGIGGGIVWDSTPQGEWDEGLLKAKFLTNLSEKPFL
ncbi:MAG: chorismate-binding protein [Candidatus Omnitrophota bacterium]